MTSKVGLVHDLCLGLLGYPSGAATSTSQVLRCIGCAGADGQ